MSNWLRSSLARLGLTTSDQAPPSTVIEAEQAPELDLPLHQTPPPPALEVASMPPTIEPNVTESLPVTIVTPAVEEPWPAASFEQAVHVLVPEVIETPAPVQRQERHRNLRRGGPGRPPGRRNKVPHNFKASVRHIFEEIATDNPELIREATLRALAGKPREAFPFIQHISYVLDGKPKETVALEGDALMPVTINNIFAVAETDRPGHVKSDADEE